MCSELKTAKEIIKQKLTCLFQDRFPYGSQGTECVGLSKFQKNVLDGFIIRVIKLSMREKSTSHLSPSYLNKKALFCSRCRNPQKYAGPVFDDLCSRSLLKQKIVCGAVSVKKHARMANKEKVEIPTLCPTPAGLILLLMPTMRNSFTEKQEQQHLLTLT